jgi:hypothetical protein
MPKLQARANSGVPSDETNEGRRPRWLFLFGFYCQVAYFIIAQTSSIARNCSADFQSAQNFMKQRLKDAPRFAVCIDNFGYPASLELHKIYRVLPDDDAAKDGALRVIDESGEDYLFSAERFILMELPIAIKRALLESFNGRKTARRPGRPKQTVRAEAGSKRVGLD